MNEVTAKAQALAKQMLRYPEFIETLLGREQKAIEEIASGESDFGIGFYDLSVEFQSYKRKAAKRQKEKA